MILGIALVTIPILVSWIVIFMIIWVNGGQDQTIQSIADNLPYLADYLEAFIGWINEFLAIVEEVATIIGTIASGDFSSLIG